MARQSPPSSAAARAPGVRGAELNGTALDLEGMPFDQGPGSLPASVGNHPLKGRARDSHPSGGLGLSQPFQIGQAKGLEFLLKQDDSRQAVQRQTRGFVDGSPGLVSDNAPLPGAGH